MYQNGQAYSITLNVCNHLQYFEFSTRRRLYYVTKVYYNLVRLLGQVSDINLQPEICKAGRIHYHGTIVFNDVFEYFCHIAHAIKEVCNVDIDTIGDQTTWDEYCNKDRLIMEYNYEAYGLPYILNNKETKVKRWESPTIRIKGPISKLIRKEEETFRTSILNFIELRDEDSEDESRSSQVSS